MVRLALVVLKADANWSCILMIWLFTRLALRSCAAVMPRLRAGNCFKASALYSSFVKPTEALASSNVLNCNIWRRNFCCFLVTDKQPVFGLML